MNNRPAILLILVAPLAVYGQADTDIEQKMRESIIPIVEFRQANPNDVLQFLVDEATAFDPEIPRLSLVLTNTIATRESFTFEAEDGTPLALRPVTLEYRRISRLDAVDRITKEMGLTYRLENGTLSLFTKDGKRIVRNKRVEQGVPGYRRQGAPQPEP